MVIIYFFFSDDDKLSFDFHFILPLWHSKHRQISMFYSLHAISYMIVSIYAPLLSLYE